MNKIIVIPKRATNGDVVKLMFPEVQIDKEAVKELDVVRVFLDNKYVPNYFTNEWWNAKYKEAEV